VIFLPLAHRLLYLGLEVAPRLDVDVDVRDALVRREARHGLEKLTRSRGLRGGDHGDNGRAKSHNARDPGFRGRGYTLRRRMHSATVHLLGPVDSACATMCRALPSKVDARHWAAPPPAQEVRPGDVVVVDLTNPHAAIEPRRLQPLIGCTTLCLVPGSAPINPQWLDFASQPGVHVLTTSWRDGLLRMIHGPGGDRIAQLVLDAEPALDPLKPLVEALCQDPWSIRRPRDLAARCRMTLGALRRQCGRLGFTRVEHFIICVRLLAYSELVATERLPIRTARMLAGFGDPSNMRRHAHRAALRSAMVERALQQSAHH